jgi:hypothetical protein
MTGNEIGEQPNVADDYASLLRDGVVLWTDASDADVFVRPWVAQLVARANADGLKAGLIWYHDDDQAFWPSVELFTPDGQKLGLEGVWPPTQDGLAARVRPLVERTWGATLERARAGHTGNEPPSADLFA